MLETCCKHQWVWVTRRVEGRQRGCSSSSEWIEIWTRGNERKLCPVGLVWEQMAAQTLSIRGQGPWRQEQPWCQRENVQERWHRNRALTCQPSPTSSLPSTSRTQLCSAGLSLSLVPACQIIVCNINLTPDSLLARWVTYQITNSFKLYFLICKMGIIISTFHIELLWGLNDRMHFVGGNHLAQCLA